MARLTRSTINLRRSLAADAETQRAMLERMAGHKQAKRRPAAADSNLARVIAWLEYNPLAVESLARAIDHQKQGGR